MTTKDASLYDIVIKTQFRCHEKSEEETVLIILEAGEILQMREHKVELWRKEDAWSSRKNSADGRHRESRI